MEGVLREISNRRCRQTPGKPERNAVPRKGDVMGMARAGNRKTALSFKHYIFFVHTAAPFKGAADFFYSTYYRFLLNKNALGALELFDGIYDMQRYPLESPAFPALRKAGDFLWGHIWAGAPKLVLPVRLALGAVRRPSGFETVNSISKLEGI